MPGGLVVSVFKVRCMRSWRPFWVGLPGLMRSIEMPRRNHQTESYDAVHCKACGTTLNIPDEDFSL